MRLCAWSRHLHLTGTSSAQGCTSVCSSCSPAGLPGRLDWYTSLFPRLWKILTCARGIISCIACKMEGNNHRYQSSLIRFFKYAPTLATRSIAQFMRILLLCLDFYLLSQKAANYSFHTRGSADCLELNDASYMSASTRHKLRSLIRVFAGFAAWV